MPEKVSKEQWIGIAAIALLLGVVVAILGWSNRHRQRSEQPVVYVIADSSEIPPVTKEGSAPKVVRRLDPNTADSLTLVEAGFPKYVVHRMLRYRAKGGRYKQVADLWHIPGMNDTLYSRVSGLVHIDTEALEAERLARWRTDSLHRDSMYKVYAQADEPQSVRKNYTDTVVELNSADTTDLKKIRGIGSYRARNIIRYRERLGGYVCKEQLRDVEMEMHGPEITDSILAHIEVETDSVKPLLVNKFAAERLSRHPYLTYTQAKALYTLRRRKVHLDSIEEIEQAQIMPSEQLARLKPYLSFER